MTETESADPKHQRIHVKKQYLMSEQEIRQDQIIETIFKNFDNDNSGSLDIGELIDLFRENNIVLDRETVRDMFNGNEFTLKKFKAIVNSEDDLNRFKRIVKE